MVFVLQSKKYTTYWSWARITLTNKTNKRPNGVDLVKLSLSRNLFAIKFTKLLEEDMIVANVDEWLVNYKSEDLYLWRKRGTSVELKSLPFIGLKPQNPKSNLPDWMKTLKQFYQLIVILLRSFHLVL